MRPFDPIEGRSRGGSRPGVGKAFDTQLGTTGHYEVVMLADVPAVFTDGKSVWTDTFEGDTLGGQWSAGSWGGSLPTLTDETFSSTADNTDVTAVHDGISIDSASDYYLEAYLTPHEGEYHGYYQIFGRMNATTPVVTTDGFICQLIMTTGTGTWTGSLVVYNAGVATTYTFTPGTTDLGYSPAGWLRVKVASTIVVTWNGTQVLSQACTFGANAGIAFGFGMSASEPGLCLMDQFRVQYVSSLEVEAPRTVMVASAGGSLYYETLAGTMTALSATCTLATDRQISASPRNQKLYIADHGGPILDAAVTISSTTITMDGVTAALVDKDDFVVELTGVGGSTVAGVYTLSAAGTGTLTTTDAPGNGTAAARVERAPKVYDPKAGTLTVLTATTGDAPLGAYQVFTYQDRVCWVKDHVCYQSRQGDPLDYDYSQTDSQAAVATTAADSEAGYVGGIITACIPFSDDYVIYGCQHDLFIQVGDLAYGGRMRSLVHGIGVISRGAWCRGPEGEAIFLSRQGLMIMPPGGSSYPQAVSTTKLPQELIDIDVSAEGTVVSMHYDLTYRGVHIYLTGWNATGREHWWLDWATKSFWPVAFEDTDHEPFTAAYHFGPDSVENAVILGCRDGYLRMYKDSYETDEGEDIGGFVEFGPIQLNADMWEGMLQAVQVILAESSGNCTMKIRVADTCEAAVRAGFWTDTKTLTEGRNALWRPRARGAAVVLRIEGAEADRRWALERIAATIVGKGRQRMG